MWSLVTSMVAGTLFCLVHELSNKSRQRPKATILLCILFGNLGARGFSSAVSVSVMSLLRCVRIEARCVH